MGSARSNRSGSSRWAKYCDRNSSGRQTSCAPSPHVSHACRIAPLDRTILRLHTDAEHLVRRELHDDRSRLPVCDSIEQDGGNDQGKTFRVLPYDAVRNNRQRDERVPHRPAVDGPATRSRRLYLLHVGDSDGERGRAARGQGTGGCAALHLHEPVLEGGPALHLSLHREFIGPRAEEGEGLRQQDAPATGSGVSLEESLDLHRRVGDLLPVRADGWSDKQGVSTVRLGTAAPYPHTSVSSSMRLTTAPSRRSSAISRSNSFGVSATGRPLRSTVREAGMISTAPNCSGSPAPSPGGAVRRNSASTRASSSSTPNGFVT